MIYGFPNSKVEQMLKEAIENFNNYYRNDVTIESITFKGKITDIEFTVSEMMRTIAIMDQADQSSQTRVATKKDIDGVIDIEALKKFRQSMKLNVVQGDYLVNVILRETNTGKIIETVNSIRPDGSSFSGTFFQTTVLPGNHVMAFVSKSNTKSFTLVNYIFTSIPKIIIQVTVSALCRNGTIAHCIIKEARAIKMGPAAEVNLQPEPTQGSPAPGKIIGNCCYGTVAFGWATGFKSVEAEVQADGITIKFKVKGLIGRGNTGFVTVTDCCGEATEDDPFIGLSDSTSTHTSGGGISETDENTSTEVSCATIFPMLPKCENVDKSYNLTSFEDLKAAVRRGVKLDKNAPIRKEEALQNDKGDYPGVGLHYNFFNDKSEGEPIGGGFGIRCCKDTDTGPNTSTMRYKYTG